MICTNSAEKKRPQPPSSLPSSEKGQCIVQGIQAIFVAGHIGHTHRTAVGTIRCRPSRGAVGMEGPQGDGIAGLAHANTIAPAVLSRTPDSPDSRSLESEVWLWTCLLFWSQTTTSEKSHFHSIENTLKSSLTLWHTTSNQILTYTSQTLDVWTHVYPNFWSTTIFIGLHWIMLHPPSKHVNLFHARWQPDKMPTSNPSASPSHFVAEVTKNACLGFCQKWPPNK